MQRMQIMVRIYTTDGQTRIQVSRNKPESTAAKTNGTTTAYVLTEINTRQG